MSRQSGYLQLRRGLWEHVRDGSLTHTSALALIYMLSEADTRYGSWKGSAQCLATALRIPRSTAKHALRCLDGRYIRRFTIPGKHVCYPILLHKYIPTQGQHVGLMLDALSSTSERDLVFFQNDELPASRPEVVQHVGPQRILENGEEKRNMAANPVRPADSRFQPFFSYAYLSYKAKHRRAPIWTGKDRNGLKNLLRTQSAEVLPLERLKGLWDNYLVSTEPFTVKQAESLAYFCSNLDKFSDGPILAAPGRRGTNGKPSVSDNIRATLEAFRATEPKFPA